MDYDKLIDDLQKNGHNKKLTTWVRSTSMYAATAIETLRVDLEQERAHRIHAEQHADAFLKDCERLDADLARVTEERDAAISDLTCIARTYPVELCDDLVCQYCKHYPNINAGCPGWTDDDCFE